MEKLGRLAVALFATLSAVSAATAEKAISAEELAQHEARHLVTGVILYVPVVKAYLGPCPGMTGSLACTEIDRFEMAQLVSQFGYGFGYMWLTMTVAPCGDIFKDGCGSDRRQARDILGIFFEEGVFKEQLEAAQKFARRLEKKNRVCINKVALRLQVTTVTVKDVYEICPELKPEEKPKEE